MGLVMRDNSWGESIGFGDVVHGGVLGFSPSPHELRLHASRCELRKAPTLDGLHACILPDSLDMIINQTLPVRTPIINRMPIIMR